MLAESQGDEEDIIVYRMYTYSRYSIADTNEKRVPDLLVRYPPSGNYWHSTLELSTNPVTVPSE